MSTVTNGYLKFQKEESGFANTVETLKKHPKSKVICQQQKGNLRYTVNTSKEYLHFLP